MQKLAPILKWAGGKRWLVPYIRVIWEHYQSYRLVEPFCGGMAVSLGVMPRKAFLNDVNPHLINFYIWIKEEQLSLDGFENSSEAYYQYRDEFNSLISTGQDNSRRAAELFLYLNKTCFNGLCRFNKSGKFNVPFGRHKNINYQVDFSLHKHVYSNWEFSNTSFEKLVFQEKDFIFADPPYDVEFRSYSKDGFSWEQQVQLAHFLSKYNGPVITSNKATDRIINLYEKLNFKVYYLDEQIKIKANGERPSSKVVIAIKNIEQSITNNVFL